MTETNTHALRKEYMLGMQTGDLECTQCGESWARDDPDVSEPVPVTSRTTTRAPRPSGEGAGCFLSVA